MNAPTRSRRGTAEGGDAALRLRVAHLLGTAALEPDGMPAAAVLVVRRLADPLPGRLAPGADAVMAAPAWERAARAALGGRWARAARPALGPVPPSAEAVRFDDRAELLACLARDLAAGTAAGRWWWLAFLRGTPATGDALPALLCADAPYVPAVLELLAAARAAGSVLNALSPAQALRVFRAVAEAFAVSGLAAPPPPYAAMLPPGPLPPPSQGGGGDAGGAPPHGPEPAPPPWLADVPAGAVPPGLGVEREALLGVALALRRAPVAVRTGAFRRAFLAWKAEALAAEASPVSPAPAAASHLPPAPGSPPHGLEPAVELVRAPGVARAPDGALPDPSSAPAAQAFAVDLAGEPLSTGSPASPPGEAVTGRGGTATEPLAQSAASAARLSSLAAVPAEDPAPAAPSPALAGSPAWRDAAATVEFAAGAVCASPPASGAPLGRVAAREADPLPAPLRPGREPVGAETELGGVFFLVNALRHLRFFEHLDGHFGVEGSLGGWGWLEVLARALLGRRPAERGDPVWRVLAVLDGRPADSPPPLAFRGAARYRLPDDWLATFATGGNEPPRLIWTRGRVRLWHPAGFAAADALVPAGSPSAAEAAAWAGGEGALPAPAGLTRRAALRCACRPLALSPPPPLRRFLELVVPYLRCRLAAAFAAEGARAPGDVLLRRRGRAVATSSHLDVHMALSEVRLSVRLAGLDANPGWVPELGRVVTFHFG